MISLAVYIVMFLLALMPPIYYQFVYHDRLCEERYEAVKARIEGLKAESGALLAQLNSLREQEPLLAAHADQTKTNNEFLVSSFPSHFHKGIRGVILKIPASMLSVEANENLLLFRLQGRDFPTLSLSLTSYSIPVGWGLSPWLHALVVDMEGMPSKNVPIVVGTKPLKILVYMVNGFVSLAGSPNGGLSGGDVQTIANYPPLYLPQVVNSELSSIKILTSRCMRKLPQLIECLHSPNSEI